ncbi:Hsp20 family protein [Aliidiomarina indica]|uniref:Hsp20 family protein n=1 Tax=Aliidiomarina indica TaxID=2749147 RepID=UPI00188FDECE|nr:Hsp20 family protein [Aliidiomarina indica]
MNTIDLTPLYRSSIGFDRLASMLDNALRGDTGTGGYPPYNIEATGENRYTITIAVAGFTEDDLDIQIERGVLTVRGKKADEEKDRNYLYQGIAARSFERKFNLAEHVEVVDAELSNGLLNIQLVKEIPEAMKPRSIEIKRGTALEHKK